MLGAAISYGTVLSDLVLFNRGTKTISAGKLSSNGKQISVLGLYNDEITEGYSVTDGTSMKYGDLELMSADGPVSVAVDFTFARLPVKNTDDEKELELHEDFDIDVPVINVSASAEQARKVTIYVGKDAPYTATINGETVESSYSDNMLTLTVPEGVHEIKIVGKHQCVFDQYATHIMNVKEWAGCGHGNIYYVSCVCQRNGTETFEDDAVKGHKLIAVEAKAATETEDGNIAYWKCKTCGICFADAKGKQELKAEDVILPKLIPDLPENTFPVVPVIIGAAAVLLVAGFVIFALKKGIFKKKEV